MDIQSIENITKPEAIRSGKSELDAIADRILHKSKNVISKIEQNIELTSSLRQSNSLISKIDAKIDGLTSNLQQYQYYLSQLNSLLIRSEYFEAQLNMLEAHNRLDSLRSSNGMPGLNDWKDKDLNWRTTEATLENLYLEYQYLTKQMEQLSDPQLFDSFIFSQHAKQLESQQDPIIEPPHQPTLQDKFDNELMNLKPIRCISKTQERQRRRSMDWKKKKPIAQIPKPQLSHTNLQNLPTPETSFDTTFNHSTTTNYVDITETDLQSPTSTFQKVPIPRRRSSNQANKHTRCASLPESVVSNMLETLRFTSVVDADDNSHGMTKDRKFSLRHFISHDTGLKTKCSNEEEEEDVKDSEFLNSPVSIELESYLREHVKRDHKVNEAVEEQEDERFVKESQEIEEADEEDVTVFEHKLNRSNSCDSIFSSMKPTPYVQRDNTQQTMDWMKKFAKPHGSYAKESNVTTISINNLSPSVSSPSRQALSNLVSQNSLHTPTSKPTNRFPYLFTAKKPSPLATTSTATTTASCDQATATTSIPTSKRQLSVDDSSSYHSFESSYSNSQQHKQWSLLLNKFKPKNLIPSSNLVTSEVGKPIGKAQPIPITPTNSNIAYKHRVSANPLTAGDKIKGSFSTLTIGPNGSRHVQHGHSSTLGQSMVLSSKISHAALKDAIDSDFIFE